MAETAYIIITLTNGQSWRAELLAPHAARPDGHVAETLEEIRDDTVGLWLMDEATERLDFLAMSKIDLSLPVAIPRGWEMTFPDIRPLAGFPIDELLAGCSVVAPVRIREDEGASETFWDRLFRPPRSQRKGRPDPHIWRPRPKGGQTARPIRIIT